MHSKTEILKSLNDFNYFIDEQVLNNFIKNWKIDAIYEDEDGIEFFDTFSIAKIKKGISLKSQGYDTDQIIYHINKLLDEKPEKAKKKKAKVEQLVAAQEEGVLSQDNELKNLTIDITGQTLQMLAEAVAQKITTEIKEQLLGSGQPLLQDASLKKDNEELSQKVDELTQDNKKLAQKIEELEKSKKLCPINFEYFRKFFK